MCWLSRTISDQWPDDRKDVNHWLIGAKVFKNINYDLRFSITDGWSASFSKLDYGPFVCIEYIGIQYIRIHDEMRLLRIYVVVGLGKEMRRLR